MENIVKYYAKLRDKIVEIYENNLSRFVKQLFSRRVEVLFLGIDNAGKTTLVQKLKNDSTGTFNPTRHPVRNQLSIGNLKANVVDLGGHSTARLVWKNYFYDCDGIIFIVDVNDNERFEVVRCAFESVLDLRVERNKSDIPIVVLMNKIDLLNYTPETAESDAQLKDFLKSETGITESNSVKIFFVSVAPRNPEEFKSDAALIRAFTWLENKVYDKK
ncbi:Small COPII coat GTPase SAR1 [Dictyocoela roeselum]|nr:Small COPII coat GTPase SAR1 [Dictyocoela roeselum]